MPASSVDPVRVGLCLGGALGPLAGSPRELERELAASLTDLMNRVGIDGRVGVATFEERGKRAVRVRVQDREVPYRPSLLWRTWLSLAGRLDAPLPAQGPDAAGPDEWLHGWMAQRDGQPMPPHDFGIVDYLCALVTAIVAQRPGCLLPQRPSGWSSASRGLLTTLLDLGVSIENRSSIEAAAATGAALGQSDEDVAEAAFAELRPYHVEVRAAPPVLTGSLPAMGSVLELFYGVHGIWAPPLAAAEDPAFGDQAVAVRVNDRPGLRLPVLAPEVLLAVEPPDDLRALGIEATPAVNPMSGGVATMVSAADRDRLPGDPLEAWEALGVAIWRALDESRAALVCLNHVKRSLVLAGTLYEDLVTCALERLSLYDLTRVLRGLVRDGVSIRNMRAILDRLLRYHPLVVRAQDDRLLTAGLGLPVKDSRLLDAPAGAELLAFLRLGLRDEIRKGVEASAPIPAARTAPALERRLIDASMHPLNAAEEEFIRDEALAAAVRDVCVIVTSVPARAGLLALVEPVLGDVPVLAEPELQGEATLDLVTLEAPPWDPR